MNRFCKKNDNPCQMHGKQSGLDEEGNGEGEGEGDTVVFVELLDELPSFTTAIK